MTITELLAQLRRAPADALVLFDFCGCVPTSVHSWRGSYNEPALGWAPGGYSGEGKPVVAAALIAELERAIDGRTFAGWKGGDYAYNGSHTLHIDNRGDCSNTEILQVMFDEAWVILHTHFEP